jgi:hypothetical protein
MKFPPHSLSLCLILAVVTRAPATPLPESTPAAGEPPLVLEDRLAPAEPDIATIVSPDWAEPKNAPAHFFGSPPVLNAFGNTAPSVQQQQGVLSGKIVFMNSGHGWIYDASFSPPWRL